MTSFDQPPAPAGNGGAAGLRVRPLSRFSRNSCSSNASAISVARLREPHGLPAGLSDTPFGQRPPAPRSANSSFSAARRRPPANPVEPSVLALLCPPVPPDNNWESTGIVASRICHAPKMRHRNAIMITCDCGKISVADRSAGDRKATPFGAVGRVSEAKPLSFRRLAGCAALRPPYKTSLHAAAESSPVGGRSVGRRDRPPLPLSRHSRAS